MSITIAILTLFASPQLSASDLPPLGASVTYLELMESGWSVSSEFGCLADPETIHDCAFERRNVKIGVNAGSVFEIEISDYSIGEDFIPNSGSGRVSDLLTNGSSCEPWANFQVHRNEENVIYSMAAEALYGQGAISLPLCRCHFFTSNMVQIDQALCYCRIT